MKTVLALVWCIAAVSLLAFPIGHASALSKIDCSLILEGLDSENAVGVFVELGRPTVVDLSTFGGIQPFSSKELMKPGNLSTICFENYVKSFQTKHITNIKQMLGDCQLGMTYQYAFNGYFITTKAKNLIKIAQFPEVVSIFRLKTPVIQRTKNRQLLGAERVWNEIKDDKGRVVDGKGVLVCVTDTGLDYTHPDFGSQKQPVGPKVVISRDLGMKDNDCQEEKMHMHGTACASIIAGDGPVNPKTGINEKGLAPKALLAGFKGAQVIDGEAYFTQEAAMGSWEYVIKDKIDISSNSWGIPTGEHEHEKPQQACVLVGATVVCANGNYGTAGKSWFPMPQSSSAAANMVIGVGATNDLDVSYLTLSDAEGKTKKIEGLWGDCGIVFDKPEQDFQLVDCLWGRESDFQGLDVKGKAVLIERGPQDSKYGEALTFLQKAINASEAGAAVVVIANYYTDFIYGTYFYVDKDNNLPARRIPVYEIGSHHAKAIRKMLHDQSSWKYGTKNLSQKKVAASFSRPQTKGSMASFSSNGPTKLGFLKPDVCAAGIGLHSAVSKYYWDIYKDYYYDNMGGTSGATPIVAGCAALVKQAKPAWSPYEIKRALMNTATLLTKFDGSSFLPFVAQGMGRVNAYEAVTTNILAQPPSALIMAENGKTNIADKPAELDDTTLSASIPQNVRKSNVPFKLYNYSQKEVTLTLSYEISSGWQDQINVRFTSTEVVIPPAADKPGSAWVGVNVKLPSKLKGFQNDIIVWMTDKAANKRIHAGICVYKGDPVQNGLRTNILDELEFEGTTINPGTAGNNRSLKVKYDVANGSWDGQSGIWQNQGKMLSFWVKDQNLDTWALAHVVEEFEPGYSSFVWDGKDVDGNDVLPDGQWYMSATALGTVKKGEVFEEVQYGTSPLADFEIKGSFVPPPPTLTAFPEPFEPAAGEEFSLAIQISNAKGLSSLDFKLEIPFINESAEYIGYTQPKTGNDDNSQVLASVELDKNTETFTISYQKQGESINGNRILLRLRFKALAPDSLQLNFSNLSVKAKDVFGKETSIKSFFINTELHLLKTGFSQADFNKDGKVDQTDFEIIMSAFGKSDSQQGFNWRCDLNYDLQITIDDLAIFSKLYNGN